MCTMGQLLFQSLTSFELASAHILYQIIGQGCINECSFTSLFCVDSSYMYSHHVFSANHPGRYVSDFLFYCAIKHGCLYIVFLVKKTVTVQMVWNRYHWILPVRFFKDTILCMHFFTAAFSAWLKYTSSLLRECYLETRLPPLTLWSLMRLTLPFGFQAGVKGA